MNEVKTSFDGVGGGVLLSVVEELRGEPIVIRPPGIEVPCQEMSDPDRLCQHPLVSVVMLAYNHEKFIEKAVESVANQDCDFEYEILLSEDCSTDSTREICFKLQRQHPEKIKVLWHTENVNKFGGNSNRALARCRGEFVAFCEGDDYWTDRSKLERQVELMRKHPSAGLCFGGTDYYSERKGDFVLRYDASHVPSELVEGAEVAYRAVVGPTMSNGLYSASRHLSTFLCRRELFERLRNDFPEICRANWRSGDTCVLAALSANADVCFLRSAVSVYRLNDTGITHRAPTSLMLDAYAFGVLASVRLLGMRYQEAAAVFADKIVWTWFRHARNQSVESRAAVAEYIRKSPQLMEMFNRTHCRLLWKCIERGNFHGFRYALGRAGFILCSSLRKRLLKFVLCSNEAYAA